MSTLVAPPTVHADHSWVLRLEEYEDGQTIRRFECVTCLAVRYE